MPCARVGIAFVENADFRDFSHIKEFYNSASYVPPFVVFDVAGNNYRVVVVVQYRAKRVYIREVMTHREYDAWCKRYRKGKVWIVQGAQIQFDIRAIQSSWVAFDSMVHLRPIHDQAGYDQMVALMNSLLDVVGEDEGHALSGLLEDWLAMSSPSMSVSITPSKPRPPDHCAF